VKGNEEEQDQKKKNGWIRLRIDMRATSVWVEDVEDRDKWRSRTKVADPK